MDTPVNVKDAYKKRYRMNTVGKDGATTTVAIPPEVINLRAEQLNISPEEFIKRFQVVAHFDNFDGIFYTFEEVRDE